MYTTIPTNLASTTTFGTASINAYAGNIWVSTLSGSWSTGSNWNLLGPPDGGGSYAVFGLPQPSSSAAISVSLDTPHTVSGLAFSDSSSTPSNPAGYSLEPGLSGSGSLTLVSPAGTFINSGSIATMQVFSGSHQIDVPITLATNLNVNESRGAQLTISGNIGESTPSSLDLSGSGTLTLSGTDNTYSGGTLVQSGTLVLASPGASKRVKPYGWCWGKCPFWALD